MLSRNRQTPSLIAWPSTVAPEIQMGAERLPVSRLYMLLLLVRSEKGTAAFASFVLRETQ
jgi:hypothetical protein